MKLLTENPATRDPAHWSQRLQEAVQVWLMAPDAAANPDIGRQCEALLSAPECRRLAAFRFERDRTLYLAAHALLRSVLSLYAPVSPAGWRFRSNPHGKPELDMPDRTYNLQFNLTHTPGLVACVVTNGPDCGIDVEGDLSARDIDGLARRMFAAPEIAVLNALQPSGRVRQFAHFWTLREAYSKALGCGLGGLGRATWFEPADAGSYRVCTAGRDEPASWHCAVMQPSDVHVLSVVFRHAGQHKLALEQHWMEL